MSYEEDGIYAINENGEIIKSENKGNYFKSFSKYDVAPDKRIWTIKKFENKYYFRTINSISILDNELNLIKKEHLPKLNESLYAFTDSLLTIFNNVLVNYNDKIITAKDSAQFLVYDRFLNFEERWNLFNELDNYTIIVPIAYAQNKLVFTTYNNVFKYDALSNTIDTLFRFYNSKNFFSPFFKDVVDDKFMFLPSQNFEQYKLHFIDLNGNLDTTIQVLNTTFVAQYGDRDNIKKTINKVVKKGNKYILLGDRNTIIIVETELNSDGNVVCKTNEISKCYGFNPDLLAEPFRLDDKIIFTFQKKNGYEQYMFELNDNSEIIKAVIPEYKLEDGKFNTNVLRARNLVRLRNYNPKTKELKLFSTFDNFTNEAYYFSTKDFFRDKIDAIQVNDDILGHNSSQEMIYTDLFVYDTKFIFGMYMDLGLQNYLTRIYKYTDNLTNRNEYILQDEFGKNKKIQYLYSENDQKYFLVYYDNNKSTLEFKTSNNTFGNYQSLYSFNNNIEFIKYKTVGLGNNPYVIYLLLNKETNQYSIEILNLKDYSKLTLKEFKDEIIDHKYINFDVYQEKIYISIGNKLFHFKGTQVNPSWDEYTLPNNGMIHNYMYIQNNFLYCKYSDDKNDLNLYKIELVDSLVNSVEIDVENEINNFEYVYLYEPYPNPSNSVINAEVFWSNSYDINNSDLGVFDINGNRVSNSTNLTFSKLTNNKGNIKWNCIGVPSGTYLIKIQHGNNTKSVKVVVN